MRRRIMPKRFQTFGVSGLGLSATHSGQTMVHLRNRSLQTRSQIKGHPADGTFRTFRRCSQGDRRRKGFPNPNPPPRSPISRTMEFRRPTISGHALRPVVLLPRLGLSPRTRWRLRRFERISRCLAAPLDFFQGRV
jgi:hypothetical protein